MLHFFWCGYDLREDSYKLCEHSNAEIPKWAEYYLGQKTSFHQSNWMSGRVTDNPHDILLGHPTWYPVSNHKPPKRLLRNWVRDNALDTKAACHPNTYILIPWVPAFPVEWITNMPFIKEQLLAANKIFALCGKIWIERTVSVPKGTLQDRVRHKLIHCNMGIASQNFPVVKQSFNPIGERQLLHISNLASYKRFDITCKSVQGLDARLNVASRSLTCNKGLVKTSLYGNECTFNYLGFINNNDLEFNRWVVENCDFYIHTAQMDAQATTILENAARGLIPLVTPESGFDSPHAIYLSHDPDRNREIIRWALNLPESELLERSRLIREYIQREHNWQSIYQKIWDEIMADIEQRTYVSTSAPTSQIFPLATKPEVDCQLSPNEIPEKGAAVEATRAISTTMPVDHRLYISRQHLFDLEHQIRLKRHVERYALLRQFARGVICDAACGCGYGTYLLSTNPDVTFTIGLDMSTEAIDYARQEYATDKIEFRVADLREWTSDRSIDLLISVETVEHLADRAVLPQFVDRNQIREVILTYPSKKTTHYNRFHHHDFKLQDILDMFPNFTCYRHFNWEYEFDVVFLLRRSF